MTDPNLAWRNDLPDPIEFEQVGDSDTLIEQIAHRNPPPGDVLAADLSRWLDRLDAEPHASHEPATLTADPRREGQQSGGGGTHSRTRSGAPGRRRLVVATAVASVLALASTGVAAAAPGSFLYPAHRVIFGGQGADERLLAEATQYLDQVQKIIVTAQGRSGPVAGDLATARQLLKSAAGLLAQAPSSQARSGLLVRWQQLSDSLAALTPTSALQPTKPSHPRPQTGTSPSAAATSDPGSGDRSGPGGAQSDTGGGDSSSGSASSGPGTGSSDGTNGTDGGDGSDGSKSSTPTPSQSGEGSDTSGHGTGNGGDGGGGG